MDSKITEIFYLVDEFCKEFDQAKEGHVLSGQTSVKRRNRKFTMSDSEVITIVILFHLKKYRCLKHFYTLHVQNYMQSDFPKTVAYNRFVELQQKALMPMAVFLQLCCLGKCTGVSFIDSTPIRVCHIRREFQHKTFKGLATKGQCSMGWFFGFKLHIVINDKGEILDFLFTQGNVDDREPLKNKNFHDKIFGKMVGDKGYISKTLFDELFIDGIHLITKIRKNMKNSLMLLQDKILLRKRALIETVNDELKNICQIERNFKSYDLVNFKSLREFNPDIIVIKISENVNDSIASKDDFQFYYERLINYLDPNKDAHKIIVNGFWPRPAVNKIVEQVASSNNYDFVSITSLFDDSTNTAKGLFDNEGVALHPSDKGMRCIAELIWQKLQKYFLTLLNEE